MRRKTELVGQNWIDSSEKRAMDVLIVAAMLPVAAPLGATALGLSRIIDGEGALFTQERMGKRGNHLSIRKIRTMRDGTSSYGNNAWRITSYGYKLRSLGIDEIPQLLNVLDGSMSIVGPRVAHFEMVEHMEATLPRTLFDEWQDAYYRSRPGGISAHTVGYHGDVSLRHDPFLKAELDIEDFKNASARHDLRLIGRAGIVGAKLIVIGHKHKPRQNSAI
ncbi:MAG TPA: sugar transferase [Candidatus Saccharimonadales bacterium]|nr:sugar transferase [Candidatus Saccharimonadales bacterium]